MISLNERERRDQLIIDDLVKGRGCFFYDNLESFKEIKRFLKKYNWEIKEPCIFCHEGIIYFHRNENGFVITYNQYIVSQKKKIYNSSFKTL